MSSESTRQNEEVSASEAPSSPEATLRAEGASAHVEAASSARDEPLDTAALTWRDGAAHDAPRSPRQEAPSGAGATLVLAPGGGTLLSPGAAAANAPPTPRPSAPEPLAPSAPLQGFEADQLIGQLIDGRWKVIRLLGQGGMGAVYEAQNISIGKRVALKFIDAEAATDGEVVTRFQREAEAASAVESAHIVQVFDTGLTASGRPYLVMEYLPGESLGAKLRREGKLSISEATHIVAQALRGLSRAHAAGVIHRDLKPDNIFLVDRDDDPRFVKLVDFGISKIARKPGELEGGTITRKGTVLGTPYYMSPEQAQALPDLDLRTDLFSMGAILFECLSGKAPCAGLTSYEAVIVAICSRDAPDIRIFEPDVPPGLAAVVTRALQRDREARFPSATTFLDALREAMPGVVSSRSLPAMTGDAPSAVPSSDGPQTGTSWVALDGSHVAFSPTLRAPEPSGDTPGRKDRRQFVLGLTAATVAFIATLGVLYKAKPPSPQHHRGLSSASVRPPPEVSLRIETIPSDARVFVDGELAPDKLLRGRALSSQHVRVEAERHTSIEREVLLDGRSALRLELSPIVEPVASASGEPVPEEPVAEPAMSAPRPSASGRPGAKPPAIKVPPAQPSSSGAGLQLKVDP